MLTIRGNEIKIPMPFFPPFSKGPIENTIEMSCILSTYQDRWEDTESSKALAASAKDFKLLAVQRGPEITPITLPTGKLEISDKRSR